MIKLSPEDSVLLQVLLKKAKEDYQLKHDQYSFFDVYDNQDNFIGHFDAEDIEHEIRFH